MNNVSVLKGSIISLFAVAAFAVAFSVLTPLTHADATCSTVGGTLLVDHTMNVANDPDSSVPGPNWALDTFARHIQIWQEPAAPAGEYCAKADDSGSFTTNGTISPQNGYALLSHVTGNFSGGTYGKITGGTFSTSTDPVDVDCNATPSTCSSGLTKFWTDSYFGGSQTYAYDNNWGWTYNTTANGTWVNQASGNTGDIYPVFDTTTGQGYGSLNSAIAAATAGDTITLVSDASTTAQVTVTKALTIDGGGHTLWPSFAKTDNSNNAAIGVQASNVTIQNLTIDGAYGTNLHGVNVYLANSVALNNVTIKNNGSGAAMIVNGSNVTATGLTTSGNAWGSVNVDPGSGVTADSVFTLSSGTLGDSTQIWSDGGHVTAGVPVVTVNATGYTRYLKGGTDDFYIWSNKGVSNAATNGTTVYSTIQAAVNAANSGDTIVVGSGTFNENVTVNKSLTLQGAQAGTAAADTTTGTPRSGSESTVTKMTITSGNVTVDGFSFTNTGTDGQVSVTGTTTLSGVIVENNMFSGYSNVGLVTLKAGNISITGNYFTNPAASTEAMQIKDFSVGTHGCSGTSVTHNVFTTASNNGASDVNISCTDSNSSGVNISWNRDSGLTDTNGTNFTALSGVTDVSITHNTVIGTPNAGSAIFFFGDVSGTALIDSNTITGISGANAVSINGGDVYGTINPANTGTFTITNNTFTNNSGGIKASIYSMRGGAINIHSNDLSSTTVGVINNSTTTIDASKNWWGSSSPDFSAVTSGDVGHEPWYADAAMTSLRYTTTTSGGQASTTIPSAATLTGTGSGSVTVTAELPTNTVVTGNSSWDGTIQAPTATTKTVTVSGFDTTVTSAVAIGSSDSDLTFDNAVKLTFAGQTGKHIGWYNHAGTFTEITTSCADNTQTTNDLLAAGASCKFDTGTDMVVWTKHFSTFVTYTQTAVVSSGGGGGGGGNGPIAGGGGGGGPVAVALPNNGGAAPTGGSTTGTGTASGGQVLGAAVYNFSVNLTLGATGADVTELQKVLIAEGDLSIAAPTGYFGALTKAAVIKYQKAHGISPTSGFVGALTRAELNKGTTPTMSDEQKALAIKALQDQVQALLAQIAAMQASSTVH